MLMGRRQLGHCVALTALLLCVSTMGAPISNPLERPALKVSNIDRSVLLGVAIAGKRTISVGERGLVVLSDDSGVTWRQAASVPVSVTLTSVSFSDEKRGWATGHSGVILHTEDAGENWTLQLEGVALARAALKAAKSMSSNGTDADHSIRDAQQLVDDGPDKPFLDLQFVANSGIAVGAYNLLQASSDGGATWENWGDRTPNPKLLHLNAVRRMGNLIFIVGEQWLVLRSLDAGRSFTRLSANYQGSWFTVAIQSDGAIVIAGLRGNVYRSKNSGETWRAVQGSTPAAFVGSIALEDGSCILANQAGQLFQLQAGSEQLELLPTKPISQLTALAQLNKGTILALSAHGPVRLLLPTSVSKQVPNPGTSK
jgi:photosystem II stability/assembly factor-like uncharacterized protein